MKAGQLIASLRDEDYKAQRKGAQAALEASQAGLEELRHQLIAGLSSGTFYPLTLSFILTNLPPRLIPIGPATYSITILFEANMASSLSAWYTGVLSWRWVFWNASWIGPIMFLCVYFGIPRSALPTSKKSGPAGEDFFTGASVWHSSTALWTGVESVKWFDSPAFAALLISGVFLVVMSFLRRKQDPNALIELPYLRNRSTILLAVMLFCFRFFLLATALLVPQFLIGVRGLRDEQVGPVLSLVSCPSHRIRNDFSAGI